MCDVEFEGKEVNPETVDEIHEENEIQLRESKFQDYVMLSYEEALNRSVKINWQSMKKNGGKYKARLIIRGLEQRFGSVSDEYYIPVVDVVH